MTFAELSAHPTLTRALDEKGYSQPTPVQASVLGPELAAADLLVSAETGSGKTVAFGLAVAPTLLGDKPTFSSAGRPLALVIAPTRELALQLRRRTGARPRASAAWTSVARCRRSTRARTSLSARRVASSITSSVAA
jgi:superfamily II DNA/RNA helicase